MNSTVTDGNNTEHDRKQFSGSRKRLRNISEVEGELPIKKTKPFADGSGGIFSRFGVSVAELAVRCTRFFSSTPMQHDQNNPDPTVPNLGDAGSTGSIYKTGWDFSNSGSVINTRTPFPAPSVFVPNNSRLSGLRSAKFNTGLNAKPFSMYGRSSGNPRTGSSKPPTKLSKMRGELHAKECMRLEEKEKYAALLQQFSTMPADAQRLMTRTDVHVDENWTPGASSILPSKLSAVSLLASTTTGVAAASRSSNSGPVPPTPGKVKVNQLGSQQRVSLLATSSAAATSGPSFPLSASLSYRNFMTMGSHPFARMGAAWYITPSQPVGKQPFASHSNAAATKASGAAGIWQSKPAGSDDGSFIAFDSSTPVSGTNRKLAEARCYGDGTLVGDVSGASTADESWTIFDREEHDRMMDSDDRNNAGCRVERTTADGEKLPLSARLSHNDEELDRIRSASNSRSVAAFDNDSQRRSSQSTTSDKHEELLATIRREISVLTGPIQGRVDDSAKRRSTPDAESHRQSLDKSRSESAQRQSSLVSSLGNVSTFNGSSIHSLLDAEPIINQTRYGADWLENMRSSASMEDELRKLRIREQEVVLEEYQKTREGTVAYDDRIRARFARTQQPLPELEDEEEEDEYPELTPEQHAMVKKALVGRPADEVLVTEFSISIKRQDMASLAGLNWLNDEIINFYMNLIADRGGKNNMPKVYAFSTFFYPKVVSDGHSGVKRWTRKVDVFAHDLLLVPVHLGVHWCLAVIDLTHKEIRYYDSMGGNNQQCLRALKDYLEAESRDKKNVPLDTSAYKLLVLKDIPQQMNGSDCGVFTCKFAEFASRRAKVTFTQAHMPYFRQRMVLEILSKKLL